LYGKNAEAVYLHAETSAISNSLNHMGKTELEKSTIYVYRVKRPVDNVKIWSSGLSKPCEGCMRAITDFKIKRIVYSTDEENTFEVYKRTN
jgi:deoxycytidylate deaminase